MSKKGVKMSLQEFMVDESLGSWADEIADLPTAPETSSSRDYPTSGSNERSFRSSAAIPTSAPFIIYMGNLDFEITDRDIEMLFGDLLVKNIRIIRDMSDKPKGFGYVEFEDQKSLIEALKLSNQSVRNRRIKLDVADQSGQRKPNSREDQDQKFSGEWRRDKPVDSFDNRQDRNSRPSFRGDASEWRRDKPVEPINSGRQERGFRGDQEKISGEWRKDKPVDSFFDNRPAREERPSFRGDASEWRRDKPVEPINSGRQERGNRDRSFSKEWRREAPVETIGAKERQIVDRKKFEHDQVSSKADTADGWRSKKTISQERPKESNETVISKRTYVGSSESILSVPKQDSWRRVSESNNRSNDKNGSSAHQKNIDSKADGVWRRASENSSKPPTKILKGPLKETKSNRPETIIDADGFSTAVNSKKGNSNVQKEEKIAIKVGNSFNNLKMDE